MLSLDDEVNAILARGAHDVGTNIDLVKVVVPLDDLVLLAVPQFAHAGVGNDGEALSGELNLALLELDVLLAIAGLKISLQPGVEVDRSETTEELPGDDGEVPPGKELVAGGLSVQVLVVVA